MVYQHDLKISWKTANQCKWLLNELFEKLKESDFPIYENVSVPTVELLGRAHECALCINIEMTDDILLLCINIEMTDDILLQRENDSLNMIQSITTGAYQRPVEIDEVVIINLYHNGTTINLREFVHNTP